MSSIYTLKLPVSPVVQSVNDIIAHVKGIKDQNSASVYNGNVFRGLEAMKAVPQVEQTPCVHLWQNTPEFDINSVQFNVDHLRCALSLFLFAFETDVTNNGGTGLQQQMDNLALWTVQSFYPSDTPVDAVNNPGMDFENKWRGWDNPQAIINPDTNPLLRFRGAYQAAPGWYVREVRLNFWTMGDIRP